MSVVVRHMDDVLTINGHTGGLNIGGLAKMSVGGVSRKVLPMHSCFEGDTTHRRVLGSYLVDTRNNKKAHR